jgi:branched-chain amino acid transport system ATP-binding protein
MLLKAENLSVYYEKIAALKQVSVEIAKGEIVAIIGANGAGKTTLINALSGILPLKDGSISFEDEKISGLPAWKVARKGLVQIPEGRKIFPKLTVLENLEIGAYPVKDSQDEEHMIGQCFELFPVLGQRKKQYGGTLSGGEQQMLAIARGLMARPKLLMFDEPSMGLAPVIVERVFDIIKDIRSKGITILLVEQNARKSLMAADRAYVLETGSISLSGTGEDLLKNDMVQKAYLGK